MLISFPPISPRLNFKICILKKKRKGKGKMMFFSLKKMRDKDDQMAYYTIRVEKATSSLPVFKAAEV